MIERILILTLLMTIAGIPVLAQTVDWDKGGPLNGPVVKKSSSSSTNNSSSRERSESNGSSSDSSSGSSGNSQRRDLPPNVVFHNGKYRPAPGFRWLNDKRNDLRVVPIPGAPYYDYPNVVWAENNKATPASGYSWLNNNPKDFRVVGNPGTPYAGHPNVMWVEEGQVSPEPGYHWVSPTPGLNGDYRVEPDDNYGDPVVPAERKQDFAELESRRTEIKKSLTALRARQRELIIQPRTSANMMQLAEIRYKVTSARSQANTINILISDKLRQSPQ